MKKILGLSLALMMSFGLAACATETPAPPVPSPVTPVDDTQKSQDPVVTEVIKEVIITPEPGVEDDPQITFTYAEVNPMDSLMGKTALAFKDKVVELSKGSIKIDIHFAGVLGSEGDVLDTMVGGGGTVDMTRISAFSLTSHGTKKTSLLSIPYTLSGPSHFWAMAKSPIGADLLKEPSDVGLPFKGVFWCQEGFRSFFTTKPVAEIKDIEGMKLRVSSDPIMTGMVEGLKAYPTVVSFNELYSSLQSGVVDGAEQPIVNYLSNSFHEVAPYMILDQHTLGASEVIMMNDSYNKMTDRQKAAFDAACAFASGENEKLSQQYLDDAIAKLTEGGVTFVEVADLKPWQDACANVISEFSKENADLYAQIVGLSY